MKLHARCFRVSFFAIVVITVAAIAVKALNSNKIFDGGAGDPDFSIRSESAPKIYQATDPNTRLWVTVRAADKEARTRLADAGMAIEEISDDRVSGIVTPNALERIKELGFRIESQVRMEEFPEKDKAFHTYGEVNTALSAIAESKKFASLFTIGASVKGRTILAVRFNSTASGTMPSDKPGIVFLGTHHAREHLSTEVPLLLAQWLADNGDKPEIQKLIDTRDIYIIPLVNPDGSEFDTEGEEYRMWRKNVRENVNGSIGGVDLNRNYGYQWGGRGASTRPEDETYRGPFAFSEPETQAVKRFINERPNLKILLSYHTFSELILYPWSHTYDPIDNRDDLKAYQAMAQKMARMTGYKPEQSSDLYISSGDTADWAWGTHHIFSFTFELTPKSQWQGGFYPGAEAIQPTFAKNLKPALYLIDLADNPLKAAYGVWKAAPPQQFSLMSFPFSPKGNVKSHGQ